MNEEISIRDIAEQDYPLLSEFLYQTFLFSPEVEPPPREILSEAKQSIYFEDFGGRHDFGVVAELGGRVVGVAWSRLMAAYGYVDDETPELAIALLPECRGRGVGTALLERLFEILSCRYHSVSLSVERGNPAKRLYERLGFKLVREDETGDYVMIKRFPTESMTDFFAARIGIYDDYMLSNAALGKFYQDIPDWIAFPGSQLKLLDLGCGTGLELEALFEKYPDLHFTGIDLTPEMLDELRTKYPDKPLDLTCASFFDADLGEGYDVVLSIYSLHHFAEDQKLGLYQKIHAALKPGGIFLLGDYTVPTLEAQAHLMAESTRIREEQGLADNEFYHIDTPLTTETEIHLMKAAGFTQVEVLYQVDNASVIRASV